LVSVGKNKKAEKSLCWLRGWVEPKKIQTEYLELIHYNEVSGINNDSKSASFFKKLAELKNPSVYGPLKLVMIIFFISNIICLSPGRSFINEIFHKVGILNNHSLILVRKLYIFTPI
jgi:SP family facilitated glucose transporter-like MFS transporter 8